MRRFITFVVAAIFVGRIRVYDRQVIVGIGEVGRAALVDIQDLVLADADHVAVAQRVAAHALAANGDAVGAVEILDDGHAIAARDQLAVMPADEAAVDLQVVVRGAPDDLATRHQVQLTDRFALGGQHHLGERASRTVAGSHGGGILRTG